jgi:hypothetical protein
MREYRCYVLGYRPALVGAVSPERAAERYAEAHGLPGESAVTVSDGSLCYGIRVRRVESVTYEAGGDGPQGRRLMREYYCVEEDEHTEDGEHVSARDEVQAAEIYTERYHGAWDSPDESHIRVQCQESGNWTTVVVACEVTRHFTAREGEP